jgi:hypothetical protein
MHLRRHDLDVPMTRSLRAAGSRGARLRYSALVFFAGSLPGACAESTTKERGQLMVAIESNLAVTKDLDEVRVEIFRADGTVLPERQIPILPAEPTPFGKPLPGTLAIVPKDAGGEAVRVRLSARRLDASGGAHETRVVREAIVKIPTDRVALLHMPLNWLCVDEVQTTDGDHYSSACGSDHETCVAGTCRSADVDANELPDYTPSAVFGGGQPSGDGSHCIDVQACFADTTPVMPDADCSVALPVGVDRARLNVALELQPQSDGHCLDSKAGPMSGNCYVPLDSDPAEGFVVDGDRIVLPKAACERKGVAGVAVSTACRTKDLSIPVCGPWTGWPASAGDEGGGGAPSNAPGAGANAGGEANAGAPTSAGTDASGGSGATGGTKSSAGGSSGGSAPKGGSDNGTGGSSTGGSTGKGTGGSGGTSGSSASSGTGGASSDYQGVLQHHGDSNRDGLYVDSAFTTNAAKNLAVDTSFAGTFSADKVYAAPLYLVGASGKPDQVFVFTDGNKAYGLDATTGTQTWTKSFGTPLSANPCGSADNGGMGITGTPVIDAVSRTIYFAQATSDGGTNHSVHALDADTGSELAGWPVTVTGNVNSGGTNFDSAFQKQRAALALVGGKVFVPFGGHVGDCGDYHGWVVGIDTATQAVTSWATRAVGGAVWGASGIASDGTSLFFATGNSKAKASDAGNSSSGDGGGMWGDSETVFKFPTSLTAPATSAATDFFVPANWVALDDADQDMGGTSPVPVDVTGATPSKLIVSLGKDGSAYLLDRTNLGGMDATPIAKLKVANGQLINAMAAYHTATSTYVVFKGTGSSCPSGQSGGLTAFKISAASPPALSMAWCGGSTSTGSPSVTSTDASGANTIVWVVGNDNRLHGLDGDTGASVVDVATALGTVQTIQTPIAAKGRIFVASNSRIYAFKP